MNAKSMMCRGVALLAVSAAWIGGAYAANLKVSSFPSGAEVIVDGVPRGVTPATVGDLAEGDHVVTVKISGSEWRPATTVVTIASGNNDLSVTLLPEADITSVIAGDGLLGGADEGDATLSLDPAAADITGVIAGSGLVGGGTDGDVTLSLDPAALDAVAEVVNNTFLVVDEAPSGDEVQFVGTIAVVTAVPGQPGVAGATTGGGSGVLGQVLGPAPAALWRESEEAPDPRLTSFQAEPSSLTNLNLMPVQGGGGIAGEFINELGGQILSGQTTGMVEVFAVHGDGSIVTDGDLTVEGNVFKGGLPFIYGGGNYQNTALGVDALGGLDAYTTGNSNTGVGYNALKNLTGDTTGNTALGARALLSNTTGQRNVAVGTGALMSSTTSETNTAVGYHALVSETGSGNTAVGAFAMRDSNGSGGNVAVGHGALAYNTIGSYNTAVGQAALEANLEGDRNTVLGNFALGRNTYGYSNTVVGMGALRYNTTGNYNIALGAYAMGSNTDGSGNIGMGEGALNYNTSGSNNIAIGGQAGVNNQTGNNNIFLGNTGNNPGDSDTIRIGGSHQATYIAGVYGIDVGSTYTVVIDGNGRLGTMEAAVSNLPFSSVAVGSGALSSNTGGSNNTAVGERALLYTVYDDGNTAVGSSALRSTDGGSHNTAMGNHALANNTVGYFNVAIGASSLEYNVDGGGNTVAGFGALYANTSGYNNTGLGFGVLGENTTGHSNTAIGHSAGANLTSGDHNVFISNPGQAIESDTIRIGDGGHQRTYITGIYGVDVGSTTTVVIDANGQLGTMEAAVADLPGSSVLVGSGALSSSTSGGNNTAVGNAALAYSVSDSGNTAVGSNALRSTYGGSHNTALGNHALASNADGTFNVAIGASSLEYNGIGSQNTAVGFGALYANTYGNYNTSLGFGALSSNTNGNSNIAIGSSAGDQLVSGNHNILIGNQGQVNESYTIRIGEPAGGYPHLTTYIAGIYGAVVGGASSPVVVDAAGQLGTVPSSRRYKEEIRDMADSSSRLLELRPVTFLFKEELARDGERRLEYGLIAEEVAEVFPDLVIYDEEGRPRTVRYELLSSMLLNEFQKLHRQLATQRRSQALQTERLEQLSRRLIRLEGLEARREEELLPARHPPADRGGAP